ncbi:MAG: glycosyltransferase [Rhodoferax sp.]|uniref:glycosyltransferase n=1 Tax=Rhodoferax sp. TaxID=50421 RepID=UPI00326796EA
MINNNNSASEEISELLAYLSWNSFRSERRKLFYVATPKVACTSLKWWFASLEGHSQALHSFTESAESDPDMVIHDCFHKVAPDITHLSANLLEESLTSDLYFRFAVVRNPYKRIFSAWQSKLLLRESIQSVRYSQYGFFHCKLENLGDIASAFESFLEHLAESETPSYWDVHWTPQASLLRPDLINYSKIVQIENTKELSQALADHLGAYIPNPFLSRRSNESLIPYLPELVTKRSSDLIRLLYAEDFDTFGYLKDAPEVKENFSSDQLDIAIKAIELIRGRHQRLGERNSKVRHLSLGVTERDGRIAQLGEAATERDGRINHLGEAIAERDGRLVQLGEAVIERDGRINHLCEAIAERDGRIVQLGEAVTEHDGRNALLTGSVIERGEKIENLTGEITARDVQIMQLLHSIVEREKLIDEQVQSIATYKEQIDNLATLASERETQVTVRSSELDRVYKSKSWQITMPARSFRRNFRISNLIRPTISRGLKAVWRGLPLSSTRKQNIKEKFFSSVPGIFSWSKTYQNWHNSCVPGKINMRQTNEHKPLEKFSKNSGKILLVAHEFSLTGAPRAVLYLGHAIHENFKIYPEIISPFDGPIRHEFEKNGFPTVVAPWLMHELGGDSEQSKFISSFDIVVVTSISAYYVVRHIEKYANKLIWWIHEDANGFEHIRSSYAPDLTRLFERCDAVWLGSPVCALPVLEIVTSDKVHPLVYGCNDVALPSHSHESGSMVFTLVGTVEPRKGQDIFLSAIEQLPENLRSKAKFRIIGSPYSEWTEVFHKQILARASNIAEVEYLPSMPFDKLLGYYAETDVIVSTSRADPMPISITQGLMFSKPCLYSSAIGHASFLENGKSGLIFESESVQELVEKIAWFLKNPDELRPMGASGRRVYENVFLMEVFSKNIANLLSVKNC